MTLKKVETVDSIEVLENGSVQVRTRTTILEDGKQLGGGLRRHVVAPGDNYSDEDVRVQAVCKVTHTPDVVKAYKATQAAA